MKKNEVDIAECIRRVAVTAWCTALLFICDERCLNEERMAIAAAKQHGQLVTSGKTYKSVWGEDNNYWVISGKDQDNQDRMVWVKFTDDNVPVEGADAVQSVLLNTGLSEDQMRDQIYNELPGVEIKRPPGMYEGEYAWHRSMNTTVSADIGFIVFKTVTPLK